MPRGYSLKWLGDRALSEVADNVHRSLRRAGRIYTAEAKRLVPVDTGELKNSIRSKYDKATFRLQCLATAEHAVYVEFGTSRMAAQPFWRPAVRRAQEAVPAELRRRIGGARGGDATDMEEMAAEGGE